MKATNVARAKELLDLPPVKRPSKKILAKLHGMKRLKGKIAVINPDNDDYIIAETLTEGLTKAIKKYPGVIFYSIRIGYSYAHEHKGGPERLWRRFSRAR